MKQLINIALGLILTGSLISCNKDKKNINSTDNRVNVVVKKASISKPEMSYQYAGKVISDNQMVLSTKLLGQIRQTHVEEGDKISVGQILVRINSKEVLAKLAAAKASLSEAKSTQINTEKNYNRIKNLFEKGSSTQRELDDITTALKVSNARIESIRQNYAELEELLTYANLRSPINGFVSQKYLNVGDIATPGRPILALESLDQLMIDISVPEFELHLFSESDPVTIRFNAIPDKVYHGHVDRLIPSTAFSGSQYKISVILVDADEYIKPGMHAKVKMIKNIHKRLLINEEVIYQRGQLKGVYTVNTQGEAMLRWLRLGKYNSREYEVLTGLDEGELYIVSAESKLVDGQKLNITKTLK